MIHPMNFLVRVIPVIVLLPLLLQSGPAAEQGGIKGQVVDVADASIAALIRVIRPDDQAEILRVRAQDNGSFEASSLPPGVYSLTAFAQGFRRREVRNIGVRAGEIFDVGQIRLDLSGCDAPGVICDYIGEWPSEANRVMVSGSVTLGVSCAVDLDSKAKPVCPAPAEKTLSSRQMDLRVVRENGMLYLAAVNRATIGTPDAPTSDCSDVTVGSQRIAIAGLGPGVDICVKTDRGYLSHVFFTEDIKNQSSTVALSYVTRKRR